jgi:hypothetical protein
VEFVPIVTYEQFGSLSKDVCLHASISQRESVEEGALVAVVIMSVRWDENVRTAGIRLGRGDQSKNDKENGRHGAGN